MPRPLNLGLHKAPFSAVTMKTGPQTATATTTAASALALATATARHVATGVVPSTTNVTAQLGGPVAPLQAIPTSVAKTEVEETGTMRLPTGDTAAAVEVPPPMPSDGSQPAAVSVNGGDATFGCGRCKLVLKVCPCCGDRLQPAQALAGLPTGSISATPTPATSALPVAAPTAPSPFLLFKEKQLSRDETAATYAAMGARERTQSLSKAWGVLSAEERAPFEKEAQALRKKFNAARKAALAASGEEPKPKRPKNGWQLFQEAKRAEVSAAVKALPEAADLQGSSLHKFVFRETASRLSALWKELSDEEKTQFNRPATNADGDDTNQSEAAEGEHGEAEAPAAEEDGAAGVPEATADVDETGSSSPSANAEEAEEQCNTEAEDQ